MTTDQALVLVLQFVIPVLLLGWLTFGRARNRTAWFLRIFIVFAYLVAVSYAGIWLILPWYMPRAYSTLFVLGLLITRNSFKNPVKTPASTRDWIGAAVLGLFAVAAGLLAVSALAGRRSPDSRTIDIEFPLRNGTYYIANGGSRALLNPHLKTLAPRYSTYRGQSFGIDIVKLNARGHRAAGFAPSQLTRYEIFGELVHAPCSGRVIQSVDGLPDLQPPLKDREHLAGNSVILECNGDWILLGHLREGSVRVQTGQSVRVGDEIGRVGNSGNTDEPHLHIHAQSPGQAPAPLSGTPIHVRFDGRFMARGTRVKARPH